MTDPGRWSPAARRRAAARLSGAVELAWPRRVLAPGRAGFILELMAALVCDLPNRVRAINGADSLLIVEGIDRASA